MDTPKVFESEYRFGEHQPVKSSEKETRETWW